MYNETFVLQIKTVKGWKSWFVDASNRAEVIEAATATDDTIKTLLNESNAAPLIRRAAYKEWIADPPCNCPSHRPKCESPGDNHSEDLFEIWHGETKPKYLCGYHEYRGRL
jgi:hypothetical protein